MFGSDVLEVAIGLVLLFLFVSLLCTALREMIETLMKSRASDLERGIAELLSEDEDKKTLSGDVGNLVAFYNHSFIYPLYTGAYGKKDGRLDKLTYRSRLPAYIPSRNFANALIDLARKAPPAPSVQVLAPVVPVPLPVRPVPAKDPADPVASLREAVAAMHPGRLQTVLLIAIDDAQGDLDRVRLNIEQWYNATMDRVSGWYKRRTQMILAVLGFVVAAAFNIDAIQIARKLNTDKSYRQAVVSQAGLLLQKPNGQTTENQASGGQGGEGPTTGNRPSAGQGAVGQKPDGQTPAGQPAGLSAKEMQDRLAQLQDSLDKAGFLMGWSPPPQLATCGDTGCAKPIFFMVLGWLVTALAVTLGAPFWFDLLNKFMVVRSTVKPAEKSAPEASKDSQPA
ncbi:MULTISPECIES: hypothetical protein [Methylobacterium]|uniref:hypothetical protein n=1 Tax=Methylobacterium TaxID=407 RepID=UPI0013ED838B|nr:hypothetical protein [Methylobacterium sp. DB0501]NGM38309.1 hypothetical protein [Methylobacterium sp. DB0501]